MSIAIASCDYSYQLTKSDFKLTSYTYIHSYSQLSSQLAITIAYELGRNGKIAICSKYSQLHPACRVFHFGKEFSTMNEVVISYSYTCELSVSWSDAFVRWSTLLAGIGNPTVAKIILVNRHYAVGHDLIVASYISMLSSFCQVIAINYTYRPNYSQLVLADRFPV